MGLTKRCFTNSYAIAPNPSLSNWGLLDIAEFKNGYVLKVRYFDCTNYEGVKIMVYRGRYTPTCLLDPHFNPGMNSPIARFAPTTEGWNMAIKLAKSL